MSTDQLTRAIQEQLFARGNRTTACEDCTRARAGIWGRANWSCMSCRARSVARCMAAFEALDPIGSGKKEALRETILRVMPDVPVKEARELVWSWWCSDHGTANESKGKPAPMTLAN